MAVVVNRYVQALHELAKTEEENNKFEQGLKEIATLFSSNEEFKKMLLDPRIANSVKMEVIQELLPEYKQEVFINFLQLLIQEKRMNLIGEIAEVYANQNRSSKNELAIKIIVAQEIAEEQIQQITDKFKKMYAVKTIQYEIEKDEKLLGGIKVVVGNTVYDASIETQLKQIF